MNQYPQDNRSKVPASPMKKPYTKPVIVVHGDVSRITGFLGLLGRGDGRTPVGGLYGHS